MLPLFVFDLTCLQTLPSFVFSPTWNTYVTAECGSADLWITNLLSEDETTRCHNYLDDSCTLKSLQPEGKLSHFLMLGIFLHRIIFSSNIGGNILCTELI